MKLLLAAFYLRCIPSRMILAATLVGLAGLSGCAQDVPVDNTAMLPESERVSTVPWNKPQGWEQTGALGQLTNDPHFQATH